MLIDKTLEQTTNATKKKEKKDNLYGQPIVKVKKKQRRQKLHVSTHYYSEELCVQDYK